MYRGCACVGCLLIVWCACGCDLPVAVRLDLVAVSVDNVHRVSTDPITLSPGANNPGGVTYQYSVDGGTTFKMLSSATMTFDGTQGTWR